MRLPLCKNHPLRFLQPLSTSSVPPFLSFAYVTIYLRCRKKKNGERFYENERGSCAIVVVDFFLPVLLCDIFVAAVVFFSKIWGRAEKKRKPLIAALLEMVCRQYSTTTGFRLTTMQQTNIGNIVSIMLPQQSLLLLVLSERINFL